METLLVLILIVVFIMIIIIVTDKKEKKRLKDEFTKLTEQVNSLSKQSAKSNTDKLKDTSKTDLDTDKIIKIITQNATKNNNNDTKPFNAAEDNFKKSRIISDSEFESKLDLTFFREIYDNIEKGNKSIFISGKAGTGKSTFVEYFKRNNDKKDTGKKNIIFVAPTGVAAQNIGAATIHSMFKFPHNIITIDEIDKIGYDQKKIDTFNNLSCLLIDEISMVRVDIIEGIDYILKKYRGNKEPFGGVQMIFVGDMYQLPPIVTKDNFTFIFNGVKYNKKQQDYFELVYGGHFWFNYKCISEMKLQYYELKKIFRQDDQGFINILNNIREKKHDQSNLNIINSKFEINDDKTDGITLCVYNGDANKKNLVNLNNLQTKSYRYDAILSGSYLDAKDEKQYPADRILELKVGAQIMMLENDLKGRWFNGTLGIINYLDNNVIKVTIKKESHTINRRKWEAFDYEYDQDTGKLKKIIIGIFDQFPVTLAWAITIHKSQGKTFDNIIVNLGTGAFVHGQVYVALSRCRTLNGITVIIKKIENKDIIVDNDVVNFINSF